MGGKGKSKEGVHVIEEFGHVNKWRGYEQVELINLEIKDCPAPVAQRLDAAPEGSPRVRDNPESALT